MKEIARSPERGATESPLVLHMISQYGWVESMKHIPISDFTLPLSSGFVRISVGRNRKAMLGSNPGLPKSSKGTCVAVTLPSQ